MRRRPRHPPLAPAADHRRRAICHLDVGRFHRFAGILRHRTQMCARKRFDAVEADDLDAWEAGRRTGFHVTRGDQPRFNLWIADQVHGRGMAVGLKNGGRQVHGLLREFDFAVVERCFQRHDCGYCRPFVNHRKAVFEVEYGLGRRRLCGTAAALEFSAIRKSPELRGRPWEPCDPLPAGEG